MAAMQNQMNEYERNRILTASPAELTLLLYEGAIKFLNRSIMAFEKEDVKAAKEWNVRAERIIIELQSTLDMKYPIAKEMDRVYQYMIGRMIDANIQNSKEPLEEVIVHVRSMRDTWKEVMKITKNGTCIKV